MVAVPAGTEFSKETLPGPHLNADLGPPRDRRWLEKAPARPFSRARAQGIADKRAWQRALENGLELRELATGEQWLAVPDTVPWHELAPLVPKAARLHLREPEYRVLARVASALVELDVRGVILDRRHVARLLETGVKPGRTSLARLVRHEQLVPIAPWHVTHGAAASRRGTAYALCEHVLAWIACVYAHARIPAQNGPASGTELLSRTEAPADLRNAGPSAHKCAKSRVGATAPPEAGQGPDRTELKLTVWRELAAGGDAYAAELLADHERRAARERVYGAGGAL